VKACKSYQATVNDKQMNSLIEIHLIESVYNETFIEVLLRYKHTHTDTHMYILF